MNRLKSHLSVKRSSLLVLWFVAALLSLSVGCKSKEPDQRAAILEEQAKILIISEAEVGFKGLFNTTFKPEQTRLLLGADLQKWGQEHPGSLDGLPDEIKRAINDKRGMGLLIQGGLPDKDGGNPDVVYLRPSQFGNGFFVRGTLKPCDGGQSFCDNCTGCSGESEPGGIIHTCVCTRSCAPCRKCSKC